MSDIQPVLDAVQDLRKRTEEMLAAKDAEIELLRQALARERFFNDDIADAHKDRERDQDFARSQDFQARGERD